MRRPKPSDVALATDRDVCFCISGAFSRGCSRVRGTRQHRGIQSICHRFLAVPLLDSTAATTSRHLSKSSSSGALVTSPARHCYGRSCLRMACGRHASDSRRRWRCGQAARSELAALLKLQRSIAVIDPGGTGAIRKWAPSLKHKESVWSAGELAERFDASLSHHRWRFSALIFLEGSGAGHVGKGARRMDTKWPVGRNSEV